VTSQCTTPPFQPYPPTHTVPHGDDAIVAEPVHHQLRLSVLAVYLPTTRRPPQSNYHVCLLQVEKERLCFRTSSFCFTGPPFGPGIAKTWIE
jgi:hypothetical protein